MANYKKNKGEKLRCRACGIAFEYNRGRSADDALTAHIRLNRDCNRYYNEEARAAYSRRKKNGFAQDT